MRHTFAATAPPPAFPNRFDPSQNVVYFFASLTIFPLALNYPSAMHRFFVSLVFCLLVVGLLAPKTAVAQTGWSPSVIATGEERQKIRSTPIEQRPNRPLHFYGNTVRRMHHRGTPLPSVSDFAPVPTRAMNRR
jgi:hypothetical protein